MRTRSEWFLGSRGGSLELNPDAIRSTSTANMMTAGQIGSYNNTLKYNHRRILNNNKQNFVKNTKCSLIASLNNLTLSLNNTHKFKHEIATNMNVNRDDNNGIVVVSNASKLNSKSLDCLNNLNVSSLNLNSSFVTSTSSFSLLARPIHHQLNGNHHRRRRRHRNHSTSTTSSSFYFSKRIMHANQSPASTSSSYNLNNDESVTKRATIKNRNKNNHQQNHNSSNNNHNNNNDHQNNNHENKMLMIIFSILDFIF